MDTKFENGILTLSLTGTIDSTNAHEVEAELRNLMEKYPSDAVVLDCDALDYATSAGLRIFLRLKRSMENTSMINVHPELYEILDTTGFTEMLTVEKAYRVLSLEGCELIGHGANGKVYRSGEDTVIKVYTDSDALPEIQHERALSRAAFVLDIPTAIPYDVVRIKEGGYGSVYELLNAKTFIQLYHDGEKSLEELAQMSTDLLKLIHSRIVKQDFVPEIKNTALDWVRFLRDYLPPAQFEKLYELIQAVPEDMHMIHGDFHFRNIMYQNGETLLIDMDKLSHGHPIFELAAMYNTYCNFGAVDRSLEERFIGLPYETAVFLWRRLLSLYLETEDEETLQAVEDRAKVLGTARMIRHIIRRDGLNTENGRKHIAYYLASLEETLSHVDTLLF